MSKPSLRHLNELERLINLFINDNHNKLLSSIMVQLLSTLKFQDIDEIENIKKSSFRELKNKINTKQAELKRLKSILIKDLCFEYDQEKTPKAILMSEDMLESYNEGVDIEFNGHNYTYNNIPIIISNINSYKFLY